MTRRAMPNHPARWLLLAALLLPALAIGQPAVDRPAAAAAAHPDPQQVSTCQEACASGFRWTGDVLLRADATFACACAVDDASFAVDSTRGCDAEAGPIWNQGHAAEVCPSVCAGKGGWSGAWITTVAGEMSVCGCLDCPPEG